MANKPVPGNPRRVLLVNPTKYLGNLLLAGGLMQAWARYCREKDITLRILIDESFRELCEHSFPADTLLYFPRRAIDAAGPLEKISRYRRVLKSLRSFRADLAFNLEEDAATSHLTRLSGAAFKLGCSPLRHRRGYDHVLPLQFEGRDPARMHRWYSYFDVFAALGMAEPKPAYLNLEPGGVPAELEKKLGHAGWVDDKPAIILHAGATKDYKKWPLAHMTLLVKLIQSAGLQAILIGAGAGDAAANAAIRDSLAAGNHSAPVDLCNTLSLLELAHCLKRASAMVGNDSGPFHLGSALGVPGLVLWGPTNKAIWGPLGENSEIVTGSFPCDPACNKGYCLHDHRCLREITPEQVFEKLEFLLSQQPSGSGCAAT